MFYYVITLLSQIYCQGPILDAVQQAALFNDSKYFVDMALKANPVTTLKAFYELGERARDRKILAKFVADYFDPPGTELLQCYPEDWDPHPPSMFKIRDYHFRRWALALNRMWRDLCRQVRDEVRVHQELYSLLFVPHPFIIPGGRFREFYYWDSYWILKGLLYSEMYITSRGIIKNLAYMVDNSRVEVDLKMFQPRPMEYNWIVKGQRSGEPERGAATGSNAKLSPPTLRAGKPKGPEPSRCGESRRAEMDFGPPHTNLPPMMMMPPPRPPSVFGHHGLFMSNPPPPFYFPTIMPIDDFLPESLLKFPFRSVPPPPPLMNGIRPSGNPGFNWNGLCKRMNVMDLVSSPPKNTSQILKSPTSTDLVVVGDPIAFANNLISRVSRELGLNLPIRESVICQNERPLLVMERPRLPSKSAAAEKKIPNQEAVKVSQQSTNEARGRSRQDVRCDTRRYANMNGNQRPQNFSNNRYRPYRRGTCYPNVSRSSSSRNGRSPANSGKRAVYYYSSHSPNNANGASGSSNSQTGQKENGIRNQKARSPRNPCSYPLSNKTQDGRRVQFQRDRNQDRQQAKSEPHSPGPAGDGSLAPTVSTSKTEGIFAAEASGGGSVVIRRELGGHLDVRVVYTREFVLQCAGSPYSRVPITDLRFVSQFFPEILRKIPGNFEPKKYKENEKRIKAESKE